MSGAAAQWTVSPPQSKAHVIIVGGGISGLSAAWHLEQRAQHFGPDVRCTVLESSGRWGGKVLSESVGGFLVEAGPDSFMTQKPWALQLARELGLTERLLGTNDRMRNVYVLRRGKPVKLPDGMVLIVPTKLVPFALSPLISPLGKLRMAMDMLLPGRRDDCDETLAEFVRRRLGDEALDTIAEPLMSGIYSAEADRQSILATFPRFRQIERDHGSLIRGMLASRRHSPDPEAPKASAFMSLRGGTQELVDALVQHLTGDLRLGTRVSAIERTEAQYRVVTDSGEVLAADALLLTTPACVSAALLRPLAPDAADMLAEIRYVSTGTISLAYPAEAIQRPLDGFGLVIPTRERRPINAITVSSIKFDQRAPEGHVLLRVFFGGSRSPETMDYDDDRLLAVVRRELQGILGIESAPLFHRIYRWHRANPQYDVGHLALVDAIEADLPAGIYVTGSAFRGVGLPDCVHQAQQTADRLLEHLTQASAANRV